jgi:NAD(P)-dependent dehydrogenase (short-subunit alcohol dehydrogenase family)
MPEATFTGRSALTTGATGRIGQAIATEFGRRGGGHVLAAGRDRERDKTVAGRIRSHGGRADFIPADLCDAAPAKDLAQRVTEVAGSGRHRGQQRPDRGARPDRGGRRSGPRRRRRVEEANGVLDDAST